jgi:phosphoribosyl-ATP pyrophosphohydrolase
LKQSTPDKL